STPLRPAAAEAMAPWLAAPGDPGRVHAEGRAARFALEEARAAVAGFLGARPREVLFTSGGTEAVNTAVFGATASGTPRPPGAAGGSDGPVHVVAGAVEHSAVLESAQRAGNVTLVGVDRLGRVDPEVVAAALRPETALVCVQAANHEVGTLQPVAEVAAVCRSRGVRLHVDACAAAGHVPLDFSTLGADLVSVSAHKLGGPRGVGALLVRRGLRLAPLMVGGAQERARRAGLENVAAAVGFAAACAELAAGGRLEAEAKGARELTDRVLSEAPARVDGVSVFGDPVERLPYLVCLGVDGVEAEPVLLALDQQGVAVHSGSSCSSETFEPSPVLQAMGVDADHSLRVSVGWSSTPEDVNAFLAALPEVVARLRALRGR
ncbi:MAG TPA: cysteine desulfurase family protein, partial [Acidimicrobiia bacterium]